MIRLSEIKTADVSTYENIAKCHQAHFCVLRVGLGTRLHMQMHIGWFHNYSAHAHSVLKQTTCTGESLYTWTYSCLE